MLKPYRVLTDSEISSLKLISKTKNSPYHPVYKEELPSVLYGNSPRQLLGKGWFDSYTSFLSKVKICQGCGKPLAGAGERHELYSLYLSELPDFNNYIIKLEGVMKLCNRCHRAIHYGFSSRLGMKSGFIPENFPNSSSLRKGPWGKAKFILVDSSLYSL